MSNQANTSNTNTTNDDFSFQLKLGKTGRKVAIGVGTTLVIGAAVYTAHRLGYLPNPFSGSKETASAEQPSA